MMPIMILMLILMRFLIPFPKPGEPPQPPDIQQMPLFFVVWLVMIVLFFLSQIFALRWALKSKWSDFRIIPVSWRKARGVGINEVLMFIIHKLIRYLEKQGIISKDQTKDQAQEFQLPISDEDVFSKLQASSITYRFATGKSKGKKAIVLKALDDGDHNSPSGLVAEHSGFSLHAGVASKALERGKLERI